jgi:hypothetical protein
MPIPWEEMSFGQCVWIAMRHGHLCGFLKAEPYGIGEQDRFVFTICLTIRNTKFYTVAPRTMRHARTMIAWWIRRHPHWVLTHA